MRRLIVVTAALALAGCATAEHVPEKVEPKIIERVEYVVRIPPAELMEIPPQVPSISVDSATQADVARWLLVSEERTRKLENMIIEIASFLRNEQLKLNGEAQKKSTTSAPVDKPASGER